MKFSPTPKTRSKWPAFAAALALTFALSGVALQSANAAVGDDIYDEGDSPNPINATNALIFYKGADLGWWINGQDTSIPIADLGAMSYTVEGSTSYAPSFQLITKSDQFAYARLVWEAYLQDPAEGPNEGTFTDLQDGLWWTNKIPAGQGSQADPQPLSFFQNNAGAGWTNVVVGAIDLHQGTTTESTSLVTNVTYDGTSIPLGDADATPFDQADVTAAVDAYASNHHYQDGTDLGWARAQLSSTAPAVGSVVQVTRHGIMARATSVKYQWYVGGKPAAGATRSWYTLPAASRGRAVSVLVTGTYKYVRFAVQSNTGVAR